MVLITFVRHGETDFNKNGILQGHLNIPLNAKGRQQAVLAGERLRQDHSHIDLVISSDLDRAYETASIIVDQFNGGKAAPAVNSIITTPLLRERYLGKLEGVDLRQFVNWEELPEAKKMIQLQNILSQKSNINSIITPTSPAISSVTSVDSLTMQTSSSNKLSSANILKHLPQKELKLESKHKLIKRAKEAFQFILKQVPQKYLTIGREDNNVNINQLQQPQFAISANADLEQPIASITNQSLDLDNQNSISSPSSTHSSLSTSSTSSQSSLSSSTSSASSISSNEHQNGETDTTNINFAFNNINITSNTNNNNSSSSLSKSNTPPKEFHILVVSHSLTLKTILSLLLCKRPPISVFCNTNTPDDITQSEQSSHQNFKWIQLELKNASIVRTSFSLIEKKSSGEDRKRLPREIIFFPVATVDDQE